MSKQRLGGGDPVFAAGEAEEYVREARAYLRAAHELTARGEHDGAARSRARATSAIGDIAARLERRFERYARAAFDDEPALVDDAVAEMFAELCRRLRDTSGANAIMEQRFNLVVKCLTIDAIRTVRRRHGLTRDGAPDTNGFILQSAEAAQERATQAAPGERVMGPLDVADFASAEPFDRVVDQLLGRAARVQMADLPPRQRRVVELRVFRGWDWSAVAADVRVSVRTVQSDLEKALATLRAALAWPAEKGTE